MGGIAVTNTSSTVVTNADGTTNATTVTTTAKFSNVPGSEGAYLGSTQTTVTESQVRTEFVFGPGPTTHTEVTTTTSPISQKEAVSALGTAFFKTQQEAATPSGGYYFAAAVAKDAKAHPTKYAIHAAGLALPFLHLPVLAEGLITGVEALHTAYDLREEVH
jgi:hypothetical protein